MSNYASATEPAPQIFLKSAADGARASADSNTCRRSNRPLLRPFNSGPWLLKLVEVDGGPPPSVRGARGDIEQSTNFVDGVVLLASQPTAGTKCRVKFSHMAPRSVSLERRRRESRLRAQLWRQRRAERRLCMSHTHSPPIAFVATPEELTTSLVQWALLVRRRCL